MIIPGRKEKTNWGSMNGHDPGVGTPVLVSVLVRSGSCSWYLANFQTGTCERCFLFTIFTTSAPDILAFTTGISHVAILHKQPTSLALIVVTLVYVGELQLVNLLAPHESLSSFSR